MNSTLLEMYFVHLDGDDNSTPPINMGESEIYFHNSEFRLNSSYRQDIVDMMSQLGSAAEQAVVRNIVTRVGQLRSLVNYTNMDLRAVESDTWDAMTIDHREQFAFDMLLVNAIYVGLETLEVHQPTRSVAFDMADMYR